MASRTRSSTLSHNYTTPSFSRSLAENILTHVAYSFLENETGKHLDYGQLRKYRKFQETLNKYFSNEMGILWQGVGNEKNGIGKRVEGKNNFYVVRFEDIPKECMNEICYTLVVCEVIQGKRDPNCTQINFVTSGTTSKWNREN